MADENGFKIKGVAAESAEAKAKTEEGETSEVTGVKSTKPSGGEAKEDDTPAAEAQDSYDEQVRRHRWCKCFCDPAQYGRDHYYLQMDTQASIWEEPGEPYWVWDAEKQALDQVAGLQQPKYLHVEPTTSAPTTSDPPEEYTGYNPKIHGTYDPTAPYAQYHNKLREEEKKAEDVASGKAVPVDYALAGTFNRFTGNFQGAEKSAERHNDYNKSGRQMGAFFDVDAAANSHNGKSLKEERRNQKLSKEQIRELSEKRRAKKEKKRMDFYRS